MVCGEKKPTPPLSPERRAAASWRNRETDGTQRPGQEQRGLGNGGLPRHQGERPGNLSDCPQVLLQSLGCQAWELSCRARDPPNPGRDRISTSRTADPDAHETTHTLASHQEPALCGQAAKDERIVREVQEFLV